MIELVVSALAETAEYQEEALRLSLHYGCEAHQIAGRTFADALEISRARFLELGYPSSEVASEIEQIARIYSSGIQEQSPLQFCLDMFELLYPTE